jgi:hypothetical protein
MAYRSRSTATRTITAKFAGKCACCGGDIPAGKMVDYDPNKRQIAHYRAFQGNSPECFGVLRKEKYPADFIDIDSAYEDQCADICGR